MSAGLMRASTSSLSPKGVISISGEPAATTPPQPPWDLGLGKFPDVVNGYTWELYHVDEDPTEFNDLATQMPDKLKALYERQLQVTQLIDSHQVALGMTRAEVQESLGKPTRTTSRLTAAGREDKLEYAVFEKVAQPAVGRTATGQLVESVIYVKVEVGTLSISFKDNVVDVIEETKGNPLRGAAVKIVPTPIFLW